MKHEGLRTFLLFVALVCFPLMFVLDGLGQLLAILAGAICLAVAWDSWD
jgi:hypothetical protein